MKISGRIDGSICGTILLSRLPPSQPAAACQLTQTAHSQAYRRLITKGYHGGSSAKLRVPTPGGTASTPNFPSPLSTPPSTGAILQNGTFFQSSTRPSCQNHTATAPASPSTEDGALLKSPASEETSLAPQRPISKEELLAMVGNYEEGSVDDYLQIIRDPYMRGYAPSDGPKLLASKQPHDINYPSLDEVAPPDEQIKRLLWNLRFAVVSRLRSPLRSDLDSIYDLYRRLPEPRMSYLHATLRHQLLRVFSGPDKKDFKSMVRYFAVVGDVKNSGLLLTLAEWNSAISFASRYVGTSTEVEAQSALKLWRELEHEAGIKRQRGHL